MTILKPSDLKSNVGKVLDAAKTTPQYVVRNGVLLVLQRVDKVPAQRAKGLSLWDALASGNGLEAKFPQIQGQVRKVVL